MVIANAAKTVGFCFVPCEKWHWTPSLCFCLSRAGESPPTPPPAIALCHRKATTALKSLLCSGTEQIKKDGMRALHASLSMTELEELEDTQDTRWTWNLFSLEITRCLICSLSTRRLNLVLFVQIKTPLKTRLEIQRQQQNWILTVPGRDQYCSIEE